LETFIVPLPMRLRRITEWRETLAEELREPVPRTRIASENLQDSIGVN
jgi:hypothetical protein